MRTGLLTVLSAIATVARLRGATARCVEVLLLEDTSRHTERLHSLLNVSELANFFAADLNAPVRLGLASFVDKPVAPYGSLVKADYCYHLHTPLDCDLDLVQDTVNNLRTFDGRDFKENQLGALVSAVNDEKVGWSFSCVKIVALFTNSLYHVAGDTDFLMNVGNKQGGCSCEDYPSVRLTRRQLEKSDVQPLFVVTQDVLPGYERLVNQLGRGGVCSAENAALARLFLEEFSAALLDLIRERE